MIYYNTNNIIVASLIKNIYYKSKTKDISNISKSDIETILHN